MRHKAYVSGRCCRGFTILEIVVAMTIMSIITVIVGSVFRLAVNAWEKGDSETGETQKLRILSGFISQQIKSAYPYQLTVDDERIVLFKGERDSVMFVTTIADSSFHGFKWVRYEYRNGVLYYKEGSLPDKEFHDKISGEDEVLDPNIGKVTFSYFLSDEEKWVDSWELGEAFPDAVRVQIEPFQAFTVSLPASLRIAE
ncbi:MAG: prepilin-type N-terminal cleavage/methylation domain-containing protein [Nitrospirae bacterium]|nr:prepilin-type N-terminal cleavage/methylation domain-containing protein [Nitrospirota bacterium]